MFLLSHTCIVVYSIPTSLPHTQEKTVRSFTEMCFIFQKINMSQIYYTQSHSCYLIKSMHISCKCNATEEVHYLLYPAIKPDLELLCSIKPELISCLSTFCNTFITVVSSIITTSFCRTTKTKPVAPCLSKQDTDSERTFLQQCRNFVVGRHLVS
ncbi:Exocyst complex component 1 [Platysternon megacephalum]|uniref:Exocyst complex component 1 n=1 Tax=Platysternon megacephalum TaxID=55544 RepID=A0A4D9FBE5_9SAUR|nr:Exocyst complex component 1 [Platysternon megacephalum]